MTRKCRHRDTPLGHTLVEYAKVLVRRVMQPHAMLFKAVIGWSRLDGRGETVDSRVTALLDFIHGMR